MKFNAKKIDLKLELTTLSGEEKELDSPVIAAEQAAILVEKFMKMDKDVVDNHKSEPAFAVGNVDKQLGAVYNTEDGWWANNFDQRTLLDIKNFVFSALVDVRKKEQN